MRDVTSVAKTLQTVRNFFGIKKNVLVPTGILAIKSAEQVKQSEFLFDATRRRKDYTVHTALTPGSYMMVVLASVTAKVSKETVPLGDQLVAGDFARSLAPGECLVRTVSNHWLNRWVSREQDALSHVLLHQFNVISGKGTVRSEFSLVGDNHVFQGAILLKMGKVPVSQEFDENAFTLAYVDAVVSDQKNPAKGQEWTFVVKKDLNSPDYLSGKRVGQKQWEDFCPRLPSEKNSMVAKHT